MDDTNHIKYMKLALIEAEKAKDKDEVPVGAVMVSQNREIISSSHNQAITLSDPTAHAENLVIRDAGVKLQNYRLLNTILYVTAEPCIMCMGSIIHARISKVVFGTYDSKWGAVGSLYNFPKDLRLNHNPEIISGICKEECRSIIQEFFRNKRKNK